MTIYKDKAIEAGKLNDRLNLVLLKYKKYRSWLENFRLKKKEKLYPDNQTFEEGLIEYLAERNLMYLVNGEIMQDSYGSFVYVNDLPKYWETTNSGEIALKNKLFPSESAKETFDVRFRLFQIIGICIAALGGLITLITFLYKFLKCFF